MPQLTIDLKDKLGVVLYFSLSTNPMKRPWLCQIVLYMLVILFQSLRVKIMHFYVPKSFCVVHAMYTIMTCRKLHLSVMTHNDDDS